MGGTGLEEAVHRLMWLRLASAPSSLYIMTMYTRFSDGTVDQLQYSSSLVLFCFLGSALVVQGELRNHIDIHNFCRYQARVG